MSLSPVSAGSLPPSSLLSFASVASSSAADLPLVEFEFTLPVGFKDASGQLHQRGTMRLATARDELTAQRDRRVRQTPAYSVLILLAQSITQLGDLSAVTPEMLEGLFTSDLSYLQEFYNRINQQGSADFPVQCPHCDKPFAVALDLSGE